MSSLFIKVEIAPYADVYSAAKEAAKLADRLMIPVSFTYKNKEIVIYWGKSTSVEDRVLEAIKGL